MNAFTTSTDPAKFADEMCDLRLIETAESYAVLLGMCHRLIDGFGPLWVAHDGNARRWWEHKTDTLDGSGKRVRLTGYVLLSFRGRNGDEALQWVRRSSLNYIWLREVWCAVLDNYEKALGVEHEYEKLRTALREPPEKLREAPEGGSSSRIRVPKFTLPKKA